MPNPYHYFESSEVSRERLLLEIELIKQLQESHLLENIDWSSYDSSALNLFLRAGVLQVSKELEHRQIDQEDSSEILSIQMDFIRQFIQHQQDKPVDSRTNQSKITFRFLFNAIWLGISILFLFFIFIRDQIKYSDQHTFLRLLNRPLTGKQRHLSSNDDHFIILLNIINAITLAYTIISIRFSRKMLFICICLQFTGLIIVIIRMQQIFHFLSEFREIRWTTFDNYLYS